MEVNKTNNLQHYAMYVGTYLGIFFILKFPLVPLGIHNPVFSLLFMLLTAAVPFLMYYYAKVYRDKVCGGSIRFIQAWLFLLLSFVFASLLVAVVHYIYFRYIDNGFIINTCSTALDSFKGNPMLPKDSYNQLKEMLDQVSYLSPIKIVFQLISQNVFYGNIFSLIVALFVMKRPK